MALTAAASSLAALLLALGGTASASSTTTAGRRGSISAAPDLAPFHRYGTKHLPDHYIVALQPGVDVDEHVARHGLQPTHVYRSALHGYALTASDQQLMQLRIRVDEVAFVEQDAYMAVLAEQVNPPSWGLDRIDQRALPLDQRYAYDDRAGANIDIYVIDTGIDISHSEFGGRARWGKTVPVGLPDADENGHGTACAGVAAGETLGVAKNASVVAIKVFNAQGFGSTADVVAGVDFVVAAHLALPARGAIASMSIGGPKSSALDAAVTAAIVNGVVVVAASGNSGADACNYSPGGVRTAITVGATDSADRYSPSSNYGPCIDLCAPGISIVAPYPGGRNVTLSGSSMAVPHVAGASALLRSHDPALTPAEVTELLLEDATKGALTNLPSADTPNLLLFALQS